MNKELEQIKSLCDLMKDTKCKIDWKDEVANIDFIGGVNYTHKIRVFAKEAKEDLEYYLEEAKDMIKYFEGVAMRLEALSLLKVFKEDKE